MAWLAAELQAMEQDMMEALRKKQPSLWKAVEEVQEEQEVKVWEQWGPAWCGVCGMWVPMLGGSCADQEVE